MAAVALVGLGLSTALVAPHLAPLPGEVGLLEATNGLPRAVGAPLEVVMQLGTLGGALVVGLGVAVASGRPRGGSIAAIVLALLLAHWLDDLMKETIERPRPSLVLDTLTVRSAASGYAFPSGHSTTAFALAAFLSLLVPRRWRWVPFGLAAGAAIARMYVGVHWPVDIIGGAALGTLTGAGTWLATNALARRARPVPT